MMIEIANWVANLFILGLGACLLGIGLLGIVAVICVVNDRRILK